MIYRRYGLAGADEAALIARWEVQGRGVSWTTPCRADSGLATLFVKREDDYDQLRIQLSLRERWFIAPVFCAPWECVARLHTPPLRSAHGALFNDIHGDPALVLQSPPASRLHVIVLIGFDEMRGFEVLDPFHHEPTPPHWIAEDHFLSAWSTYFLELELALPPA